MIRISSANDDSYQIFYAQSYKLIYFINTSVTCILAGDGGEITTAHILLGIWFEVESPGYKILSALGFNDEKAKELQSLISKPGFTDD